MSTTIDQPATTERNPYISAEFSVERALDELAGHISAWRAFTFVLQQRYDGDDYANFTGWFHLAERADQLVHDLQIALNTGGAR